jgi:hypothetical protein
LIHIIAGIYYAGELVTQPHTDYSGIQIAPVVALDTTHANDSVIAGVEKNWSRFDNREIIQVPQEDAAAEAPASDEPALTERVAKLVAGTALVGNARALLERASHHATIAANRITVDREVEAQLVHSNGRSWWTVSAADGTPPTWTVGAQIQAGAVSSWIGAVE